MEDEPGGAAARAMAGRRRVAVVTGASAGVGRATAVELARRGFDVGLLGRGGAGLAAAADDVRGAGGRALVLPVDVADADAVDAAAGQVESELGALDVWVNNAMTTVFAPVAELSAAELRRATEVTYLGQVHGTMAALRRMRPRDRGVVCNVGSALAFRAIPLQAAYCGAKFAVRGFTEAVRAELLADGSAVRITEVHLPAVNTPQFGWCRNRLPRQPQPVPPIYGPDVAARAIADAVERPRRQRVLGGFNHFLVLANKVAPGVLDHYVARTGTSSQQTDEPADPDRPGNLWAPLDADTDAGARGAFRASEGGMTASWWAGAPGIAADVARSAAARAVQMVAERTAGARSGRWR